jgi:hypothetical protein
MIRHIKIYGLYLVILKKIQIKDLTIMHFVQRFRSDRFWKISVLRKMPVPSGIKYQ